MSSMVIGNILDLSIGWDRGEKHLYGDIREVDYFSTGLETPPSDARYFLSVYPEKSTLWRDLLHTNLILNAGMGDERREAFKADFEEWHNAVSISSHRKDEKLDFISVSVMLAANDFIHFSTFVEAHFGSDLEFLLTFPFLGFSSEPGEEYVTTKDEFYSGKPYVLSNGEMKVIFRKPRNPQPAR